MRFLKPDGVLAPGWLGQRRPRACVIGLGLIGGSWAGALNKLGWRVTAVDSVSQSLEQAKALGWIEDGFIEIPSILDVDLIVLALPLPLMLTGLSSLAGKVKPGVIVTDVGSLKREICLKAVEILGKEIYFVGGHPMAGSERSGFASADPGLFRGYPYVLIPADDCPEDVVNGMVQLVEKCGAHVVLRPTERHDLEVAMVSHLPHLLALALTLATADIADEQGSALQLAGRSFREITRIVESSPEMWQEIMIKNSEAILSGLDLWQKRLDGLRKLIEENDGEGISGAFRAAAKIRRDFVGSQGE